MTAAELKTLLAAEVKSLSSKFVSADYDNAVDAAERDTGWSMPVTTDFKIKWMIERSKRHLFFYLLSEAAHKFKYKQISLNQRFEHYSALIKLMDADFAKVQEENAHEFAGVDPLHLFGTKVDAGFQYLPQTGQDYTYGDDNTVIVTPDENA